MLEKLIKTTQKKGLTQAGGAPKVHVVCELFRVRCSGQTVTARRPSRSVAPAATTLAKQLPFGQRSFRCIGREAAQCFCLFTGIQASGDGNLAGDRSAVAACRAGGQIARSSAELSADGCWLASKRQHLSKDNHSGHLEVLFGFARERTFYKEKELEGLHCRGESLNLARPSPSETRDRPLRVIKCLPLLFKKENVFRQVYILCENISCLNYRSE